MKMSAENFEEPFTPDQAQQTEAQALNSIEGVKGLSSAGIENFNVITRKLLENLNA